MIRIPEVLQRKVLNVLFPNGKKMDKSAIMATISACRVLMPYFAKDIQGQDQESSEKRWTGVELEEIFSDIAAKAIEKIEERFEKLPEANFIIKNCESGIFIKFTKQGNDD